MRNPQRGPSENFQCPHCGAGYSVTYTHLPARDRDKADCDVCGEMMDSWNATSIPSYQLVRRPDFQREAEGREGG